MKKHVSSLFLYLGIGMFIAIWWSYAFKEKDSPTSQFSSITISDSELSLTTSSLFPQLSLLQREHVHRALEGDIDQILQLMINWDIDAQILSNQGFSAQRLDAQTYTQVHLLHRQLKTPLIEQQLANDTAHKTIVDDQGHLVKIEPSFHRFLPQTFVAASILLAIAPPEEIIALPSDMRLLTQLYSPSIVNQIPHDTNYYQGDRLTLAKPQIAFTSSYSHPATIRTLEQQGIQVFALKGCDSIEDIQTTLLKIGHATHHPLKAQLLQLFIEACLINLDNRIQALGSISPLQAPKKCMYLYYDQHYMLPTEKCLTGQLLKRAFKNLQNTACLIPSNDHEWRIPLTQEQLLNERPNILMISHHAPEKIKPTFEHQSLLHNLPLQKVFYLDENIQESPTQYVALAYFDIFQALAAAHLP